MWENFKRLSKATLRASSTRPPSHPLSGPLLPMCIALQPVVFNAATIPLISNRRHPSIEMDIRILELDDFRCGFLAIVKTVARLGPVIEAEVKHSIPDMDTSIAYSSSSVVRGKAQCLMESFVRVGETRRRSASRSLFNKPLMEWRDRSLKLEWEGEAKRRSWPPVIVPLYRSKSSSFVKYRWLWSYLRFCH